MFILQIGNLNSVLINAAAFWAFFSPIRVLLILGGLVAIFAGSILYRFFNHKRKNKKEVVHPITNIVGSDSERIDELNRDLNPFGFYYEPYQDLFYSLMNGWQRDFGYCRLYDEGSAALSMIIDCEPIRFEYHGKKWLIEFWKGQYGMTSGGEVGIYYTDGPDLNIPGVINGTFYYSIKDQDRINMSFALRKNGNLLFTRSGYHWWLTGFKLAEFSKPSELSMDIMMDLYDRQMTNAFVQALKKAGYKEDEFAVNGRRVYIHFAKPHTPQPISRTAFTEFIMQKNNESLCHSYNRLTKDYTDTLDKLEIVRNESPNMYNQILSMGKPRALFKSFDKIKGFLTNNGSSERE